MPTKKPLDLITEEDRARTSKRIAKRNAKRAKQSVDLKDWINVEKKEKGSPKSEKDK